MNLTTTKPLFGEGQISMMKKLIMKLLAFKSLPIESLNNTGAARTLKINSTSKSFRKEALKKVKNLTTISEKVKKMNILRTA
jgi:fatty acid-binding protein DegV